MNMHGSEFFSPCSQRVGIITLFTILEKRLIMFIYFQQVSGGTRNIKYLVTELPSLLSQSLRSLSILLFTFPPDAAPFPFFLSPSFLPLPCLFV